MTTLAHLKVQAATIYLAYSAPFYLLSLLTHSNLQIERMMEVGEDTEYEQTAMRVALNSEGGKKIENLVRGKIHHLKVLVSQSSRSFIEGS